MPKILAESERRVPLNCLIAPATRNAITQLCAAKGVSQGAFIDSLVDGASRFLLVDGQLVKSPADIEKVIKRECVQKLKPLSTTYRGPILKPKDRK